MKKILLLISQERDNEEALHYCLELASHPEAELFIAYILDDRFREKYESLLSESTFVADKPGQEVCAALNEEYQARGRKILETLKAQCVKAALKCETDFYVGDYYETAKALCFDLGPARLVISERSHSFLRRAMGLSDKKKLEKMTGVEVVAF